MSGAMSKPVTAEDAQDLFRIILKREVPADDPTVMAFAAGNIPLEKAILQFLDSVEFRTKFTRQLPPTGEQRPFRELRNPKHLHRSAFMPRKVLLVGSCLIERWVDIITSEFGIAAEWFNVNNGSAVPELSAQEAASYDFQIVQLLLRGILKEPDYWSLPYGDDAAWQQLFEESCAEIDRQLETSLRHNRDHGMQSFVLTFTRLQQNSNGKLTEKYRLSNLDHFISELNRHLDRRVREIPNAFVLDLDELCGNIGRCWVGEDGVTHLNHGSLTANIEIEGTTRRIVAEKNVDEVYINRSFELICAAFEETLEMRRALMQHDAVKIVIFDLDDTLWRGIAAEADELSLTELAEGWPRGMVEAASLLWRRGILVALCSRNDAETVGRIWARVYGRSFPIENFVVRKINWAPKADNIREILQEVNLLPESALFVDDNPAERAAVQQAMPGIRVLDLPLVEWRRTLIWASELQPATVTGEAAGRTQTIKAQIARSAAATTLSPEEHLRQLQVRITPSLVREAAGRSFERCIELINKTNQFNTTGRRWDLAEMAAFFKEGGALIAVSVEDRHAAYGLTGVAMVCGARIEQLVLSCRVFGMGVEQTLLALALQHIAASFGETQVTGRMVDTGKNRLAHELFAKAGLTQVEPGIWRAPLPALPPEVRQVPAHVTLTA